MDKVCGKCKKNKSINEFIINGKEYYVCFNCYIWRTEYENKNKEKLQKQKKIYRENNIIKLKEYYKKYNRKESTLKKGRIRNKTFRIQHRNKAMFYKAKERSKKFNLDFNLEFSDIVIPEICPLLNIPLSVDIKRNLPTLDRINNNIGYIKENVLVISNKANQMKNNLNLYEIKLLNSNYDKIGKESITKEYKKIYVIEDKFIDTCDTEYNKIKFKVNIEKTIFSRAKRRAKLKNIEFNITIEDIVIPDYCPLLEIPIILGNEKPSPNSPTLDRIDNTKGYIKENVRIISAKANLSKSDSTKEEYNLLATNLERIMKERGLI